MLFTIRYARTSCFFFFSHTLGLNYTHVIAVWAFPFYSDEEII